MTVFNCNGECESCRLSRRYREDGDDYYTCDSKSLEEDLTNALLYRCY